VLAAAEASGVVEVLGAADACVDAAGAALSLLVDDELRETTTSASKTIPTTTAIITRLEDLSELFFADGATLEAGTAPTVLGRELIDFDAIRVPEVGTGGITIEAAVLFFATFFALFFTLFLAEDFLTAFLTAFLAVFFTADFFTAFLAEVFLAGDFLLVFFAVFFTATFELPQMDF
jgi:hypothetical protein